MEDIKEGLAEIFPAADLLNALHIFDSKSDRTLKSLPEVNFGKLKISQILKHVGKGNQLCKLQKQQIGEQSPAIKISMWQR